MKSFISNTAQDRIVDPRDGVSMPSVPQPTRSSNRVFSSLFALCLLALAAISCTKNPGEVRCLGCDEFPMDEVPIILDGTDPDTTNIVIDDTLIM
jgi:hypothetical protein